MSEAALKNTEVTSSGSASVCFWSRLPRDQETSVIDEKYAPCGSMLAGGTNFILLTTVRNCRELALRS